MKNHVSFRTTAFWALVAVLLVPVFASSAQADPRAEARAHYEAGSKAFAAGDFQVAIREFESADRLAPAPVLDYNVALALEALGQKRDALLRYRRYLDRDPRVANRAEVEGRIRTLSAEIDADEARRASEAKAAEEARKADEARAAEEARKAEEARRLATPVPPPAGGPAPAGPGGGGAVADPGMGGAPAPAMGGATYAPTGDAGLDRVAQLDVAAVGASRSGGGELGAGAPAMAPENSSNAAPAPSAPAPADDTPKAKPLYKQWWFWAVVGVSAIILIDIATTDSNSTSQPVRGSSTGATIFTF